MKLAVTIDTEADGQWDYGRPVTTRNVAYWAPFQDLCERHGVTPTYLVATEIAEDERARALLQDWSHRGAAEIGAHLHPWTTPPFIDRDGLRYNDEVHAFPSQLPRDLLRQKIEVLTGQLTSVFGSRPTSFRAGRFGLDAQGTAILAETGYLVDSSVTPLWSWRGYAGLDGEGGPDFRRHSPLPFRIADLRGRGLIEIPVTIVATYRLLRDMPMLLEAYRSLPVRAIRKTLLSRWLLPQPMWLSPDPRYSSDDLDSVWQCAEEAGLETAVMMFHSSELMPGGSPFRPDRQSVRELLECLDAFFSHVRRRGGRSSTLSEMSAGLAADSRLETRPL